MLLLNRLNDVRRGQLQFGLDDGRRRGRFRRDGRRAGEGRAEDRDRERGRGEGRRRGRPRLRGGRPGRVARVKRRHVRTRPVGGPSREDSARLETEIERMEKIKISICKKKKKQFRIQCDRLTPAVGMQHDAMLRREVFRENRWSDREKDRVCLGNHRARRTRRRRVVEESAQRLPVAYLLRASAVEESDRGGRDSCSASVS